MLFDYFVILKSKRQKLKQTFIIRNNPSHLQGFIYDGLNYFTF